MDKNYNVDDILSEIKLRKSREKSDPTGERSHNASVAEFEFSTPVSEPPAESPEPQPLTASEFHFTAPEPEDQPSPAAPIHEALNFEGEAVPLTDRAKTRRRAANIPHVPTEPSTPDLPFQTPDADSATSSDFQFQTPESSATAPIDFSAFRAANGRDLQGETRILPQISEKLETQGADLLKPSGDHYYDEDDDLKNHFEDSRTIDFSEYNSLADRRDVATDIARVKLWLFIRVSVTALLTVILFWFSLSGKYPQMPMIEWFFPEPETMRAYMIACTALTALVALVNSSTVGGGLISLFKMRANSDTLATLAILAAIAQGVSGAVKPETVTPEALNLYFPVAALSMLFNALGKMNMISRIQTNFRLIATDKKKKALDTVSDERFCREFTPGSVRRPTIAFGVAADFFTDFLGLSYSDKFDVGINRAVAPVCLAGSIVVAVVCYLLTKSSVMAIAALTVILCISATFSATFIENIPLGKLTKKLAPQGGVVSGNKAVEDFCDTEAVILTESDLFPEGHIQLRGIKTFSQSRIDEAIRDAASVICSLNGALSPVFLQMIGGDRKLLKKVDNVVYENGMGVSAWVNSRRVLIGNRQLMQNHGIMMPAEALHENRSRAPEEGELLYLANSGEVAAQFAVSYHIDDPLADQLDLLATYNKTLIIHTTDANITPTRIAELYGYPEELIHILPAEWHSQYRELTVPRQSAVAEIVYTGRASTMVASIVACIHARSSILSATVIQLIQIVLGYGLVTFLAFMGAIGSLNVLQLCVYQLFWFLIIFLLQQFKQS